MQKTPFVVQEVPGLQSPEQLLNLLGDSAVATGLEKITMIYMDQASQTLLDLTFIYFDQYG